MSYRSLWVLCILNSFQVQCGLESWSKYFWGPFLTFFINFKHFSVNFLLKSRKNFEYFNDKQVIDATVKYQGEYWGAISLFLSYSRDNASDWWSSRVKMRGPHEPLKLSSFWRMAKPGWVIRRRCKMDKKIIFFVKLVPSLKFEYFKKIFQISCYFIKYRSRSRSILSILYVCML